VTRRGVGPGGAGGGLAVLGAGSVGLCVGARLARAGCDVLFLVRRPAAARAIEREGVTVDDPGSGERFTVRAAAAVLEQVGPRLAGRSVLLCTRASDTEAAGRALARLAPAAAVASLQNDVDNAERLAPLFDDVVAGVYRQTCTRVSDCVVRAGGSGRIVLGAWPSGIGSTAEGLAADLRAAGYDVGLSSRIEEDLWLKLCVNLMSAPNALVRREDHETRAFVEGKARLLEEARAILAAAGIAARSCDGRDRSLDQEIAYQRASLAQGTSARRLPLYNQVWSALRSGGPVEADRYHRRILELAARHAVPAPVNTRVLELLEAVVRERRGPECVAAAELLQT
jgi:2-dehydropantoate 2-reductase